MSKIKLNLETIVKMPIVSDPTFYVTPDGCGCAFGIAFAAAGKELDFNSAYEGSKAANSNYEVMKWKDSLRGDDPVLWNILRGLENKLFARNIKCFFTDEVFKKEMIDELTAAGHVGENELSYSK